MAANVGAVVDLLTLNYPKCKSIDHSSLFSKVISLSPSDLDLVQMHQSDLKPLPISVNSSPGAISGLQRHCCSWCSD